MASEEITNFDQLKGWVGREVFVGQWVPVTQEMVDKFAEATGDSQFIHVDPELARETSFGGTIAHGYLTLALLAGFLSRERQGPQLILGERMRVNYGLNRVRFMGHVPVGRSIRARVRLLQVENDPTGAWTQVFYEQTVELEGSNRPAMVAETITRFYF
jgi:acyl dehydratase